MRNGLWRASRWRACENGVEVGRAVVRWRSVSGIFPRRALPGLSEEPVELGLGHSMTYPCDVPHICDALEQGSTVVMALEDVQEGVQNAAPVSGPDRCPRAG